MINTAIPDSRIEMVRCDEIVPMVSLPLFGGSHNRDCANSLLKESGLCSFLRGHLEVHAEFFSKLFSCGFERRQVFRNHI